MKTIAIFPASKNSKNPYQDLVELSLKKAGFQTKRIPNRKFFPFFQLLDNQIDYIHFYWPHDFYKGRNIITGFIKRLMFSLSLLI